MGALQQINLDTIQCERKFNQRFYCQVQRVVVEIVYGFRRYLKCFFYGF